MIPPVPPPIRISKTATRKRHTIKKRFRAVRPRHAKKVRYEVSAGGVLVRQDRGRYLVALLKTEHRRGSVWVLPKGHVEMEKRERVADAAKREVQEEAGVHDITVREPLGSTRFVFQAEEALVKKTVHYFLMVTEQEALAPQEEEGFLEAAWFPIHLAVKMLEYDTDQTIVAKAQGILEGKVAQHSRIQRNITIHS